MRSQSPTPKRRRLLDGSKAPVPLQPSESESPSESWEEVDRTANVVLQEENLSPISKNIVIEADTYQEKRHTSRSLSSSWSEVDKPDQQTALLRGEERPRNSNESDEYQKDVSAYSRKPSLARTSPKPFFSQDSDSEEWILLPCSTQNPEILPSGITAKWTTILETGLAYDVSRITCLLPQTTSSDNQLISNILSGRVLSAQMHPLIFENVDLSASEVADGVKFRSIEFFEKLVADWESNNDGSPTIYNSLTADQKLILSLGIRDLYLTTTRNLHTPSTPHEHILQDLCKHLAILENHTIQISGLRLSFHPCATHKLPRLIPMKDVDEPIPEQHQPLFAQMDSDLILAFADPEELSYHNFENIVPLDRWLDAQVSKQAQQHLDLQFTALETVGQGEKEIYRFTLSGSSRNLLHEVGALNLYTPPLNKSSRGGKRFIFHSAGLSKALTRAVRDIGVLEHLSHGSFAQSFEFVNYVFRCNRFVPGEAPFISHRDTPYYDRQRSHVSKYTLLIYMTSGTGAPVLRVEDMEIRHVREMTCILFDQRYVHEGNPFLDTVKVFIRTELIFKDEMLVSDERVAPLFGRACYMTAESVFDSELTAYAHECFERANSLHWAIESEGEEKTVYLHKKFCGKQFITNGYDYWFPRGGDSGKAGSDSGKDQEELIDSAILAILDYFNCKLSTHPFRKICQTSSQTLHFKSDKEIWTYLARHKISTNPFPKLKETDIHNLLKSRPSSPFIPREFPDADSDSDEEEVNEPCCPLHAPKTFNAWTSSPSIQALYKTCTTFTHRKLSTTPILLLNQTLTINPQTVKILGDKIFLDSTSIVSKEEGTGIAPINFASCWSTPQTYELITTATSVWAPKLVIPPLRFTEVDGGWRLVVDFFRNDWMVHVDDERRIPVPVISNDIERCGSGRSGFLGDVRRRSVDWDGLGEVIDEAEDEGGVDWEDEDGCDGDGGGVRVVYGK